jgi:DNA repair protein RadA/Sms
VSQVRQCAAEMIDVIKEKQIIGILIGHITKDGNLAGPKVLEHMVDVILYFEGQRNQKYRMLRCFKNRHYNTQEVGIFEMKEGGLMSVTNPFNLLISQSTLDSPGAVVSSVCEGSRVLLVEIQALVVHSGYGMAKRTFLGVDTNRANLMIAAMEKILNIKLSTKDIILNIIGGLKVSEPALDLGVVLSVLSSLYEFPIGKDYGVIGEVGLTGEVRSVDYVSQRLRSFEKMGFKGCLLPETNRGELVGDYKMSLIFVKNIGDAIRHFKEISAAASSVKRVSRN